MKTGSVSKQFHFLQITQPGSQRILLITGLEEGNLLNIGLLFLLFNILFSFQVDHVPYVSNTSIMKNSQQRPVNPGEMLFKTDLMVSF